MNFAGMLCAPELFDESREFIMVKISLWVIGIRKRQDTASKKLEKLPSQMIAITDIGKLSYATNYRATQQTRIE